MKQIKITLILILCVKLLNAQSPLVKQWDYRYGGTNGDDLSVIIKSNDGAYLLGGRSKSDSSGDKTQNSWNTTLDYWIIKVDSLGYKLWDKRFGGYLNEYLAAIAKTENNGFILGGSTQSGIGGDKTQSNWSNYSDFWVVKIDSAGNKLWDRRYGGTDEEFLEAIEPTSDGGFILAGSSNSGISGDKSQPNWTTNWGYFDYWIIKIDSAGNKEWDKRYGGTNDDRLYLFEKTIDGGYVLGGNSSSDSSGDKTQKNWDTLLYSGDYWIVKIDSVGNKLWDKRFGGKSEENLSHTLSLSNGDYLLGGTSLSGANGDKTQFSWGGYDLWFVKIDSVGNKIWDKRYGGNMHEDEFTNSLELSDGSYILSGTSYSNISGNKTENNLGIEQMWLLNIGQNGNKKWDKTIFTNGHDEKCVSIFSNDGCLILAGSEVDSGGYVTQPNWDTICSPLCTVDFWIIKFCDTTSTTSVQEITNANLIFINPNPVKDKLNVAVNNNEFSEIIIYDIASRKLLQQKFTNSVSLNTSQLAKGIYIYEVKNKNGVIKKGKVVKE